MFGLMRRLILRAGSGCRIERLWR